MAAVAGTLTRRGLLAGTAAAALAMTGCRSGEAEGGPSGSPATPSGSSTYFFPPAFGDWATVQPQAAGLLPDPFAAAMELGLGRDSVALIVCYRGRIVAERYSGVGAQRRLRPVQSVQKSISGALVANAAAAGKLDYEQPVSQWLGSGWSHATKQQEAAITIRHLLSMTSGLTEELRYAAPAGSTWSYNNVTYQLLHPMLERATKQDLADWSSQTLFAPIGITDALWARDPVGVVGYGLALTARDMARFGLLILTDGLWNGLRVLPADYPSAALRASQPNNPSYGLLWWLNSGPDKLILPAPADLVAAEGAGGQRIYVVPSMDLVVVRMSDGHGPDFDEVWWQAVMQSRDQSSRPSG
jgi:CubicO group peptidase (beta-lactamase class C family)